MVQRKTKTPVLQPRNAEWPLPVLCKATFFLEKTMFLLNFRGGVWYA
jgi:hypothetical protein